MEALISRVGATGPPIWTLHAFSDTSSSGIYLSLIEDGAHEAIIFSLPFHQASSIALEIASMAAEGMAEELDEDA